MITTDYERCTGCGACVQRCPQQCIKWTVGEFGFKYPSVDENKCVGCDLCDKVCTIGKLPVKPKEQIAYALVNMNKTTLLNSTSGGAFSALAGEFLEQNGVVYGCEMDTDFQVRHIRVAYKDKLWTLRGSKYVQSDTNDTFVQVKKDLADGRKVLYSGTPCQIAGLYGFLGGKQDNLTTVDIICHGVGSQAYFDKFVEHLKVIRPGLTRIEFRNKKYVGWSCGGIFTSNGEDLPFYNHEHYYYSYFLSGEIYRKSCYSCPYANMNRIGDITLGDFWGVERLNLGIDISKGCSLVIANNNKGKALISGLCVPISMAAVDIEDAVKYNEQLSRPSAYKESREKRLKEYNTLSADEIQKIYKKTHADRLVKGKIKTLLPYNVKSKLRGLN